MTFRWIARFAVIAALALAQDVNAQWFDPKSPGIPRLPDGKPDLDAPWPKLATGQSDLSGIWGSISRSGFHMNVIPGKASIMNEAGAKLFRERIAQLGSGWMAVTCMPYGPVAMLTEQGGPIRIYQNPTSVALLFGSMSYRVVYTDGRELPKDPSPAWMGYSVGRWEGDTLNIESLGFRDDTWLDPEGHPHSEELRLTERLRRRDFGHIEYEVTFSDPVYYKEPFSLRGDMEMYADFDAPEYICNENERDKQHLQPVTLPTVPLKLSPAELAAYAGTYSAGATGALRFLIQGEQLVLVGDWPKEQPFEYPMEPLGDGAFIVAGNGVAQFSKSEDGQMRVDYDSVRWVKQ